MKRILSLAAVVALTGCNTLPSDVRRQIADVSQQLQQTERQLQRTSGEIRDDLSHSPDLFASVASEWRARLADAQSKLEGARSDGRQLEALDKTGRKAEARVVFTELLTQLKRAPKYVRRVQAEWIALAEKALRG